MRAVSVCVVMRRVVRLDESVSCAAGSIVSPSLLPPSMHPAYVPDDDEPI